MIAKNFFTSFITIQERKFVMNVNFTPQIKQSPNFKSVSIVQVSKKAFANPENFKACSKSFGKALDTATGDRLTGLLANLVALFTAKPCKTGFHLESPSYISAKKLMDKYGINYSMSWLKQNTGLPIKEAVDNDYHSFYVFTKEHKGRYVDAFHGTMKKILSNAKEAINKYSGDKTMATIYANLKTDISIDKAIDEMAAEAPVKKFKLDSLDEIKNIVKDLDV